MRWYGRLRRSSEIVFVRRRGRPAAAGTLTGFAVFGGDGVRVGITVSKAVGGAVMRNRVRRRIRAALDAAMESRPQPMRAVFVAKPAAAGESFAVIQADIASVLGRWAAAGT